MHEHRCVCPDCLLAHISSDRITVIDPEGWAFKKDSDGVWQISGKPSSYSEGQQTPEPVRNLEDLPTKSVLCVLLEGGIQAHYKTEEGWRLTDEVRLLSPEQIMPIHQTAYTGGKQLLNPLNPVPFDIYLAHAERGLCGDPEANAFADDSFHDGKFQIRLRLAGYKDSSSKQRNLLRQRKQGEPPLPITRAQLAWEVYDELHDLVGSTGELKIADGKSIKLERIILRDVQHVSSKSVQPTLAYAEPDLLG